MIFTLSVSALGSLLLAILASVGSCRITAPKNITQQCISPRLTPDFNGSDFKNIGVVLFRAFDMFDVFGPLEVLQMLALQEQQMDLHFIAETLDPVTTEPAAMNPFNSSFWPVVPVTNTFNDDIDLDLLLIPGGAGVRAPNLQPVDDYIKRMFPKVKVLMTVCTGSALAARTGVMDGHLATTNKKAWDSMTGWRKEVQWVSPARFVIDGKVWSSSGVSLFPALFSNSSDSLFIGHFRAGRHLCIYRGVLGH